VGDAAQQKGGPWTAVQIACGRLMAIKTPLRGEAKRQINYGVRSINASPPVMGADGERTNRRPPRVLKKRSGCVPGSRAGEGKSCGCVTKLVRSIQAKNTCEKCQGSSAGSGEGNSLPRGTAPGVVSNRGKSPVRDSRMMKAGVYTWREMRVGQRCAQTRTEGK